LIKIAVKSCR